MTTHEQAAGWTGPAATTPLRPGGAAPAGGATHCPTCRCVRREVCTCGHVVELHDLVERRRKGVTVRVRTACSVSTGRKATPCGCLAYAEEEGT